MDADAWAAITTADARACLSLCRPTGCYVANRQCRKRGPIENTQIHQSGLLALRPLTPAEDEARGMLGSIVASDSFRKSKFELKDSERLVLPKFSIGYKNIIIGPAHMHIRSKIFERSKNSAKQSGVKVMSCL